MFLAFVVALQLAFGIWQCVEYSTNARAKPPWDGGVDWQKVVRVLSIRHCFS